MSEVPKLEIYIKSEFGEPTFTKDDKNKIIYLNNLKEVNAFWDKYKSSIVIFKDDYPYQYKKFKMWCKENKSYFDSYDIVFKNWLHDLLYKVE